MRVLEGNTMTQPELFTSRTVGFHTVEEPRPSAPYQRAATSVAAAVRIEPHLIPLRQVILDVLRDALPAGLTDRELHRAVLTEFPTVLEGTVRCRRREAVIAGEVIPGWQLLSDAGRPWQRDGMTIWYATTGGEG